MSNDWKDLIAQGRHEELGKALVRMAGIATTLKVMEDAGIESDQVIRDTGQGLPEGTRKDTVDGSG